MALALALAALAACACSLRSLDYLEDAADAGDAGPADGASGADAGDASSDGGLAPDADASSWCAQHPTADFCADFDEDPSYTAFIKGAARVVQPSATGGATFSLDPSGHASARALLLGAPGGVTPSAQVVYDYPSLTAQPSVHTVSLSFALRMHAMPSTGEIDIVALRIAGGPGGAQEERAYISIEGGQGYLIADAVSSPASFAPPALEAWANVLLTVDVDQGTATLTLDGAQVGQLAMLTFPPAPRAAAFRLGLEVFPDAGASSVTIDDVAFVVQ